MQSRYTSGFQCFLRNFNAWTSQCHTEFVPTEVYQADAVSGSMGFVKEKRLHKYYLNGNDATPFQWQFIVLLNLCWFAGSRHADCFKHYHLLPS